ncbi:MAG: DCC1-like thiol-disulfide oxidoreductase family protein [Planctomycetota bacterium]
MTEPNTVDSATTVVLFDGVCNLCNRSINWIIDRDPASRIRYLPLQSQAGRALAEHAGLHPEHLTTMVAIRSGQVMKRSSAALHIGTRIESPLALLSRAFLLIPAVLRDLGYRVVAHSRYVLFGKMDACRVPTPDLASRFLDPDDVAAAFDVAGLRMAGSKDAADGAPGVGVHASAG